MTRAELIKERLKRKTEAEVQREIRQYLLLTKRPFSVTDATITLNLRGQRVQRVREGWPDITTLTLAGKFFGIECKRPIGGALRREQALMLRKIHEAGGVICIARSVDCVIEAETHGTRQRDLDEINKALSRPIKSGLEGKPINEFGF